MLIYSSIKAINKTSIKPYMILNTSSGLILTPIITSEMFLFAVTYLLLVCWEVNNSIKITKNYYKRNFFICGKAQSTLSLALMNQGVNLSLAVMNQEKRVNTPAPNINT
jgi:hypothetical protein